MAWVARNTPQRGAVIGDGSLCEVVDVRSESVLFAAGTNRGVDSTVDAIIVEGELGWNSGRRDEIVYREFKFLQMPNQRVGETDCILPDLGIGGTRGFGCGVELLSRALGHRVGVADHARREVDVDVLDFLAAWEFGEAFRILRIIEFEVVGLGVGVRAGLRVGRPVGVGKRHFK
jgi:hypothetical protein